MKHSLLLTGVVTTLMFASTAFAQSTVTGTLTSGASGTGTSTGTSLSGSVGTSSNSLSGTVVATSTSSTGGGGGGGGTSAGNGPPVSGGGGGSGSGTIDICPNLDGVQSSLPAGYVIVNGNCDPAGTAPTGSVLGASTNIPNVPNTGEGGNAQTTILTLGLALLGTLGGSVYLAQGLRRLKG